MPAIVATDKRQSCNTCLKVKSVDDFQPSQFRARSPGSRMCRDCCKIRIRSYYASLSPEQRRKRLEATWDYRRRREEEFQKRVAAQQGKCAICGNPPPPDQQLVRDHDHATGAQRSLLCNSCNYGLGCFKDQPDRLLAAAAYLLNAPQRV